MQRCNVMVASTKADRKYRDDVIRALSLKVHEQYDTFEWRPPDRKCKILEGQTKNDPRVIVGE